MFKAYDRRHPASFYLMAFCKKHFSVRIKKVVHGKMIVMPLDEHKRRMGAAIEVLAKEFGGIRSGKVTPAFLDPIRVSAYGGNVPLSQVGNVNVIDAKMLSVQVWDHSLAKSVEKAIRESNLGLSPIAEGASIRVPIPSLTEERRQELSKMASKYAEDTKISIRNIRRDAMDGIKKQEKNKEISEDEMHRTSDDIQKMTDEWIKKIDEMLSHKQKEIMHV